jgi:hypothetical protein
MSDYCYAHILWGVIRRHSDYISFCNNHEFGERGWLRESQADETELHAFKKRFGLMAILHFAIDADRNHIDTLFYSTARAVSLVPTDTTFPSPPISHIRIDIDMRTASSVILAEIKKLIDREKVRRNYVVQAMQESGIAISKDAFKLPSYPFNRYQPESDYEAFCVWDLHWQGKTVIEIIREMWPDEAGNIMTTDTGREKLYSKLCKHYRDENYSDWDERAFHEAYGTTEIEYNRLLKRVGDKIKRMKRLLKVFDQ